MSIGTPSKLAIRLLLATSIVLLFMLLLFRGVAASADSQKVIYFYYGQGCSHCAKVESYFEQIKAYDTYPIEPRELYFNADNAAAFNATMGQLGVPIEQRGVPTVVMDNNYLTGDTAIISDFATAATKYLETTQSTDSDTASNISKTSDTTGRSEISTWLIISAATVDAINPCAFAVLILLLTTVLAKKQQRSKVIASGLAFSLMIFVSYLLMGLGLYKALTIGGVTALFTTVVGILAIVLGLLNLKDWLWYGKTPPLEVPMSWRPRMARIIERVTNPVGAALAGLIVSLFLLPCTSGPYIVVLGLLANNPFDAQLLWYLVLYNLVFVSPMLIITGFVAFGTSTDTLAYLREKYIDKLHLIAGVILIGLGLFVLLV